MRVLISSHGFMGRDLGEADDALRLFAVGPGEIRRLNLQRGEQFDQFMPAFRREGVRGLNPGFNSFDGFFDHICTSVTARNVRAR